MKTAVPTQTNELTDRYSH